MQKKPAKKTVKRAVKKTAAKRKPKESEVTIGIGNGYDLDEIDMRIIQLKMSYPGIKNTVIGKAVNLHRTNVSIRISKPAFQQKYRELQQGVFDRLYDMQSKAVEELSKLLSSKNEAIRFKAANALVYGDPKILRKSEGSDSSSSGMPSILYDFSKATPQPSDDDVPVQG